jgi:hypothetical protein
MKRLQKTATGRSSRLLTCLTSTTSTAASLKSAYAATKSWPRRARCRCLSASAPPTCGRSTSPCSLKPATRGSPGRTRQTSAPARPCRRRALEQPLHRNYAQHLPNETAVCNLGSINMAKLCARRQVRPRPRSARGAGCYAHARQRYRRQLLPDRKDQALQHAPPPGGPWGSAASGRALQARHQLRLRRGGALLRREHGGYRLPHHPFLALLAKERGTYETYKGSSGTAGIFPQDTLALLEQSAA